MVLLNVTKYVDLILEVPQGTSMKPTGLSDEVGKRNLPAKKVLRLQ